MIDELKPLLTKFIGYAKDNLKFEHPPRLFLRQDTKNQKCVLGKTAHYDPVQSSVTLYISGRHPKDVLRSFAHELVHHCQNERGDLAPEKMKTMNGNYAQENEHMRKMEEEAYLRGNMCFRDWEDGLDDKLQYTMKIAEQKYLKENKKMSVKISKKELKSLISKLLESRLEEDSGSFGEMEPGPVQEEDPSKKCEGCENPECKDCNPPSEADDSASESAKNEGQEESKIQTPEQENTLYESRFSNRNTRLYEKLLKQWTK